MATRFTRPSDNFFPRSDGHPLPRGAAQVTFPSRTVFVVFALVLLAAACAAPRTEPNFHVAGRARHIFIVHDKWHAAIVAKAADIAADDIPELAYFPEAEYIEFSWGDADFFPAAGAGILLAARAAFWSRGSVLHLVGFSGAVKKAYRGAEIIEIELTGGEFQRLIRFIAAEFDRSKAGRPAVSKPGLFPHSRFFSAKSKFGLFRNCNTWVAKALSTAGLPISPGYVITAGSLARQVRQLEAVKLPASQGRAARLSVTKT